MGPMFECDQCEYKSKTKSALIMHHNYLHNMVKHKCSNCGSQFYYRLNGTIAKYSRLCHKVGRRRSQRHLVQDGDGRSYNPNSVAPVAT